MGTNHQGATVLSVNKSIKSSASLSEPQRFNQTKQARRLDRLRFQDPASETRCSFPGSPTAGGLFKKRLFWVMNERDNAI